MIHATYKSVYCGLNGLQRERDFTVTIQDLITDLFKGKDERFQDSSGQNPSTFFSEAKVS